MDAGSGKHAMATGLTIKFNTGLNPALATNPNLYQVRTMKGKKLVKLKKKGGITYNASTETLTLNFAKKTAVGSGFMVVLSPGAVVAADGQVMSSNTIVVAPSTSA